MGKMIDALHALLIEYEKGLPKKAATPYVMAIQGGRIQKANKKSLNAKGKEHPTKDETCHHYKEVGHWKRNCPTYLAKLIKNNKLVGTAILSDIFVIELYSFPTKSGVYDTSCGTHICNPKHGLRRTLKALRSDRGDGYISQEFKDYLKACEFVQQLTPSYTPQLKSAVRILNMVPTKKVDKTPYELWIPKETMGYYFYFPPESKIVVARYTELLEKNIISQEINGRAIEIQDEDTSPSENTSEILMEFEGFKPPQEELILVRRIRLHFERKRSTLEKLQNKVLLKCLLHKLNNIAALEAAMEVV
nr:hypothetical protein [Tanacetum cinerariifolium]